MNWDIVPVIPLPNSSQVGLHENAAQESAQKSNATSQNQSKIFVASASTDQNVSKSTIAMAVVIPLSCVIIISSLAALICYFYATPVRTFFSHVMRSRERPHLENGTINTATETHSRKSENIRTNKARLKKEDLTVDDMNLDSSKPVSKAVNKGRMTALSCTISKESDNVFV